MTTPVTAVSEAEKAHWAYQEGHSEGMKGNTTKRGIMAFGLGFAAARQDAYNTKLWLAGFDAGAEEKGRAPAPPSPRRNDVGDRIGH
jgi:hypothetical protein